MNDINEAGEATTAAEAIASSPYQPLRTWPLVILMVGFTVTLLLRLVDVDAWQIRLIAVLGPGICGILVALWWLTLSRARWSERLLGLLALAGALAATYALLDVSMTGGPVVFVTVPMGMAAFGLGGLIWRNTLAFKRTMIAVTLATIGFGFSTLLRGEGMWGNAAVDLDWRFNPSAEDLLVAAKATSDTASKAQAELAEFDSQTIDAWLANPEWSGFRGNDRSGDVTGIDIDPDWTANPPKLLWKTPVGPGWSSFAVAGRLLFTQEQRGEVETVVCYDAESGSELWNAGIEERFEESLGGPGPRATPTIAAGDLFVMGASGWLMRLNARTGEIIWKTDLRSVANRQPPTWGFSSSPLVVDSLVIVHAGGADNLGTLAFDIEDGNLQWAVAAGDHSYSSPQLCEVNGTSYVTMVTNRGVDFINPKTKGIGFTYDWDLKGGYRSLQPRSLGDSRVLIPSDEGSGTRLIGVTVDEGLASFEESWTSRNLKPDFNDLVVFDGHAYGFDGTIFASIDLETGNRNWKRGRYGKGQVVLLRDSGLLLIAGEKGQVVLLKATPESHQELATIEALDGKTWNHPVVVGDRLYLRNGAEAACYQLPIVAGTVPVPSAS